MDVGGGSVPTVAVLVPPPRVQGILLGRFLHHREVVLRATRHSLYPLVDAQLTWDVPVSVDVCVSE